jgi:uncharacterized protein YrrD
MYYTTETLSGFRVMAEGGEVGRVHDCFFDESGWHIRYIVVRTGPWLLGRDVIIVPGHVRLVSLEEEQLSADLTREELENSPDVDTEKPISRQREIEYLSYYGMPMYWGSMPGVPPTGTPTPPEEVPADRGDTPTDLRSAREITGYALQSQDGNAGSVTDIVFSPETWAVTHLLVRTGGWFSGKRVAVAIEWVEKIDWSRAIVEVNVPNDRLRDAAAE